LKWPPPANGTAAASSWARAETLNASAQAEDSAHSAASISFPKPVTLSARPSAQRTAASRWLGRSRDNALRAITGR
jgi:hypothetical protein